MTEVYKDKNFQVDAIVVGDPTTVTEEELETAQQEIPSEMAEYYSELRRKRSTKGCVDCDIEDFFKVPERKHTHPSNIIPFPKRDEQS